MRTLVVGCSSIRSLGSSPRSRASPPRSRIASTLRPTAPRFRSISRPSPQWGHVVTTTQAAPNMLGLRRLDDADPAAADAFRGFDRRSAPRAALQVLRFVLNLWALLAVLARQG